MTYFLVLWIAYSCPGWWLGKLVPSALRPIVCEARLEHEVFDREKDALKKVAKEGCGARLFAYRGLRQKERRVTCETVLRIED